MWKKSRSLSFLRCQQKMPSRLLVLLLLFLLVESLVALTQVSETQLAQLFGRLADKRLLLDVEGAGTPEMRNCCHGGCDNCDFSRIFDEMNAGKPKWVACYPFRRLVDGREHLPAWAPLFEADATISASDFADRVNDLDFRPAMGPRGAVPDEPVPTEAAVAFFEAIAHGADKELDATAFANGLKAVSGEIHGAPWKRLLKGFTP